MASLACLLEPIYWPDIIQSVSFSGEEQQHWTDISSYRDKALRLIEQLDAEEWSEAHQAVRLTAARIDDNPELYILLRVSLWEVRRKLTGRVAGALWIRHLAEVIRRAFEEARGVQWAEEDRAFGVWHRNGRVRAFGSERPLDDVLRAKPYLAYRFGLFTGSAVRWYVEGETEFYAVTHLLPELSKSGIELVNLAGAISTGKENAAIKLGGMLAQDKLLRRFSIVSFDRNPKNRQERTAEKVVCQLAKEDQIVGLVWQHAPDFEFANFTIAELVEVAARLDESHGFSGETIRDAEWGEVATGRAFEERYCKLSARRPGSLKGAEWGMALGRFLNEKPQRDDGPRRPVWDEISAATLGWNSNYEYEKAHFRVTP